MLKEDSAPMTAHESGAETVLLRREMGGDEGKDIQRESVDGSEGVPRFTDGCEYTRDIPLEFRKLFQSKATVAGSQRVVLQ